ncbi:MAG: glucose sorbosone dehydrogenase, partial [Pseudomonadota bacterium]
SIGPGAATVIEDFHPVWDGDILIGGFRNTLERVHEVDSRVAFVESINLGVRSRDMVITSRGEIVIWTDNLQLIFLTPSTEPSPEERVFSVVERMASAENRAKAQDLMGGCLQCHGLAKGDMRAGPSLHDICDAQLGSVAGYDAYSDALSGASGVWTEDRLAQFIADPQSVVPGTTMEWGGTENMEVAGVVARAICATVEE